MSIVNMEKIAVIGLNLQKEKLISDLMDVGMVQISQSSKEDDRAENKGHDVLELSKADGDEDYVSVIEGEMNRTNIALETLKRYSTEKEPIFFTRRHISKSMLSEIMEKRAEIESDIGSVLKLNSKLHICNEQINKYNGEIASLKPWAGYDIPLDKEGTKNTALDLGVIPSTVEITGLRDKIKAATDFADIREINRDKDYIYVVNISVRDLSDEVLTILKQYGYNQVPFKGFEGTVTDNLLRLEKEVDRLRSERSSIEKEISALTPKRKGIECLYDFLTMERDRAHIKSSMRRTEKTFNFEGWVPAPAKESVNKILDKYGCYYIYREPEDGDQVPVLVENRGAAQPFESVMEMYSLPDYNGIDPTNIFAFFYAMFFGIMLSDAGYGLVISIVTFVILKKFEIEGSMKKLLKMFFYCGLSTVFWGAMFGSWFGDLIQVGVKTLTGATVTIKPLWFNPIDDPTRLLIWSLGFGVVHLFVGMGINAYMLIKRGKFLDAVFDIFSWYGVILGGIMYLAGGSISPMLARVGIVIALVGAAILLITGGRNKKGIGKVTGGLGALYNVTSYVSDILSYARLLALGLATGVIATVVNTMGSLGGQGIVSFIVLCVVGIIGHTFNMAINVLGAFVHSSRLQYIEFFGKFYEDGGEEFSPFKIDTKYIKILNDNQEETK
ncbi:V/A-type H+-transporting ATPase subunit I [Peptostreptococcaceae bacterium pGA-8]|nr:V/A-type H+-transporting ATPase subunit I [Peptostreptococcaceae bacterium pGA-8]